MSAGAGIRCSRGHSWRHCAGTPESRTARRSSRGGGGGCCYRQSRRPSTGTSGSRATTGAISSSRPGGRIAATTPAPSPRPTPPAITTEIVRDYGSLGIRGRIAGIDVWLDDRRLGATETGTALVVSNLAVGTYTLKARKLGHKDWDRTVEVAANRRTEVVIDIEALGPAKTVKGDDGAEMVLVPAGEFTMGSNDSGDSQPPHRVYLDAFYIDRYETTNGLYLRFMDATGRPAPLYWSDGKWNGVSQPAVGVSWFDANAYCQGVGTRLPTEAEWEKAARGAEGRRYPWGDPSAPTRAA